MSIKALSTCAHNLTDYLLFMKYSDRSHFFKENSDKLQEYDLWHSNVNKLACSVDAIANSKKYENRRCYHSVIFAFSSMKQIMIFRLGLSPSVCIRKAEIFSYHSFHKFKTHLNFQWNNILIFS